MDAHPLQLLCFFSQPHHSYHQLLGHSHCHSLEEAKQLDKHLLCHTPEVVPCIQKASLPPTPMPSIAPLCTHISPPYTLPQPAEPLDSTSPFQGSPPRAVTYSLSLVCQELEVCELNPRHHHHPHPTPQLPQVVNHIRSSIAGPVTSCQKDSTQPNI